jgi:hypothetical protein
MKNLTLEQQELKMVNFLKEAFCIDGECKRVKVFILDNMPSAKYELNDSKRGKFYVTISANQL